MFDFVTSEVLLRDQHCRKYGYHGILIGKHIVSYRECFFFNYFCTYLTLYAAQQGFCSPLAVTCQDKHY
jgi:hypothetical protein